MMIRFCVVEKNAVGITILDNVILNQVRGIIGSGHQRIFPQLNSGIVRLKCTSRYGIVARPAQGNPEAVVFEFAVIDQATVGVTDLNPGI
jgi:hypothetical protein